MNSQNHLPTVSNQKASDEMTARPDDLSSVHTSLAGIEEEATFAGVVNDVRFQRLQGPSVHSAACDRESGLTTLPHNLAPIGIKYPEL